MHYTESSRWLGLSMTCEVLFPFKRCMGLQVNANKPSCEVASTLQSENNDVLLEPSHIMCSESPCFCDSQVHWDVCGSMDEAHSQLRITVWRGWEGFRNMYHRGVFSTEGKKLWLKSDRNTPNICLWVRWQVAYFTSILHVRDVLVLMCGDNYVQMYSI